MPIQSRKEIWPPLPAAGNADRAALLLPAVDPVGELIVGRDVVQLRGRLVVPGAPGPAAVDRDDGPLVRGEEHDVGLQRVDPDPLVVVAAGRALDRRPRLAAVVRSIRGDVADKDDVGVRRVHADVEAEPSVLADERPAFAAVVRAVEPFRAAPLPHHRRIQAIRIAGPDAEADASGAFGSRSAVRLSSCRQVVPPSVDL